MPVLSPSLNVLPTSVLLCLNIMQIGLGEQNVTNFCAGILIKLYATMLKKASHTLPVSGLTLPNADQKWISIS